MALVQRMSSTPVFSVAASLVWLEARMSSCVGLTGQEQMQSDEDLTSCRLSGLAKHFSAYGGCAFCLGGNET